VDGSGWREKFVGVQEGVSLEEYQGRSGNIFVISPHPDDDVLGAGGTMAEAASRGKGVLSVYITDGRDSPRLDPNLSDEGMAIQRTKEAIASLKVIGAAGGFFLQKRSTELEGQGGKETQKELAEIIQGIMPQEIYLPSPYERHRTHQRCTRLAIEALRSCKGLRASVLGFSLWGNFWGGKKRVVRDIGPHIRKKVEAVLAHSSQIAYKNYQQGILGKNNAEAIFWESHEIQRATFVETFLDMTELLGQEDLTLENFIHQDVEEFIRAYL
jgi:LmbE family N-acetylglucosaminyl deacetylase